MKQILINIGWITLFIHYIACYSAGQVTPIGLEEAISLAAKDYSGLQHNELEMSKYQKMAESGKSMQAAQIFLSSEEYDFTQQSGVHSLNIQQNFYLPGVSRAQKDYFNQAAQLADAKRKLTKKELERAVSEAFLRVLYATQMRELDSSMVALYEDFLNTTTLQLDAGEAGVLPQMAAKTRLGQAQLELEHAEERMQISLALFNHWLPSESEYMASGSLEMPMSEPIDTHRMVSAHLTVLEAKTDWAQAQIETQKAQLLPQINSGFRLQNAFGTFPVFGYQLGVNVPLFRKAYENQIEAAKIAVKSSRARMETESFHLKQKMIEIQHKIEHQKHIVSYLRNDLQPLIEKHSELSKKAYREGETSYLAYLDGLEQVVSVRKQYLEAIYELQLLTIESKFWYGN